MHFEYLATEIINNVFLHCGKVDDVLALSTTCKRFRCIYSSSSKLSILQQAAECQYGPLEDAIQLVTHNASQPAHIVRTAPFSLALLEQLVHTGKVADKWCDIYPFKKWKHNFEDRRLLTSSERFRLRRALYRIWLYSRAFHNRQHPRDLRMTPPRIHERAELLHNWSTAELAEMADVHAVLREVVTANICPSNGTITRKFRKRYPDPSDAQLLFNLNIHVNYPPPPNPFAAPPAPPPAPFSEFHCPPPTDAERYNGTDNTAYYTSPATQHAKHSARARFALSAGHDPGAEGWGDDVMHYYVVEDMLKLDPAQLLWLKERAPLRAHVEEYVRDIGRDWFDNNGETWCQTLEWVLRERGEDAGTVGEAVRRVEAGVVVED